MNFLKENIQEVEKNIEEACRKSNRNPKDITLICVSKTKPVEMIEALVHLGYVSFGENKVQELVGKIEHFENVEHPKLDLHPKLDWHLIGHLQTNKVKYIVDKVSLIHSVDSMKLAAEIDKEARKKNVIANILIETNIANEDTKFGVTKEACLDLVKDISRLENVRIQGLMTIAPYVSDGEENRVHFKALRELARMIESCSIENVSMKILSMGMTGDYQVAIEEGATHIRVGTGIFGERQYHI